MPPLSHLSLAKGRITEYFAGLSRHVFRYPELAEIFATKREEWQLSARVSLRKFVEFLLAETELTRTSLEFPYRPETLYTWGAVSTYRLVVSVKSGAYICQQTAAVVHGLADNEGHDIYVNYEQRPLEPPEGPLVQARVDAAFRRPQRRTTNIAILGNGIRVHLMNGKHTGNRAVIDMHDEHGHPFSVTSLERTLIDIAVRPAYAGGVNKVLEAYRRGRDRLSPSRLRELLYQLDYVYPYHQAVGFYLQNAGINDSKALDLFRTPEFAIDFYLAHGMKEKRLVPEWRLYVPAGIPT